MFDRKTEIAPLAGKAGLAARRRRLTLLRRFGRSQDGATAVEFGFIAAPFLMLLWAIFETALMFWTTQVLEEAVTQASRAVLTGESRALYTSGSAAVNTTAFRDAVCARAPLGLIDCSKLAIDVRNYANFSGASSGTSGSNPLAGGNLDTSTFSYSAPAANQIVVVRAVLDYKLFLTSWASYSLANIGGPGSGRRGIIASVAFRTEPFV